MRYISEEWDAKNDVRGLHLGVLGCIDRVCWRCMYERVYQGVSVCQGVSVICHQSSVISRYLAVDAVCGDPRHPL